MDDNLTYLFDKLTLVWPRDGFNKKIPCRFWLNHLSYKQTTYDVSFRFIDFVNSHNNRNCKIEMNSLFHRRHLFRIYYIFNLPLASLANLMTSFVCCITLSSAATTNTIMSVQLAPLALIALNAA